MWQLCGENCAPGGHSGIDWASENDRLLVLEMLLKLSDIGGPTRPKDLHLAWVHRLSEEFFAQGDDERTLGLPVSPYMDRARPQIAKLQVRCRRSGPRRLSSRCLHFPNSEFGWELGWNRSGRINIIELATN